MIVKSIQLIGLMFFMVTSSLFAQQTEYQRTVEEYRNKTFQEFKDSAETPLTHEDRKTFEGLNYFKIDSTYKVIAKFVRTPDEEVFEMKTSTERRPEYVKYGEAYFELKGKKLKLNVYQNVELSQNDEYKDYLFIPFKDLSSGESTYGGGRFMDAKIPEGDSIIIDFNKAYNPYCAYNHKYSCPVPPKENFLEIEVHAGEKIYHH